MTLGLYKFCSDYLPDAIRGLARGVMKFAWTYTKKSIFVSPKPDDLELWYFPCDIVLRTFTGVAWFLKKIIKISKAICFLSQILPCDIVQWTFTGIVRIIFLVPKELSFCIRKKRDFLHPNCIVLNFDFWHVLFISEPLRIFCKWFPETKNSPVKWVTWFEIEIYNKIKKKLYSLIF